jgi:tetratricopeptide (TPR) repeat protein
MKPGGEPTRSRRGLILILFLVAALAATAGVVIVNVAPKTSPPLLATQRPMDLARAAYLDHDGLKAEKILRDILRDRSDDRDARLLLGQALADRGRLKEARESFETVLQANGKDVDALRGLGQVLRAMGAHGSAVKQLQMAVDLGKSDPTLWKEFGLAQRDAGDTYGAFSSIQKSLALDPEQADLSILLGDLVKSPVLPGLPGQSQGPGTAFNPTTPAVPDAGLRVPNRPRTPGTDSLFPSSDRGNPR